jgi:hypothetical protein
MISSSYLLKVLDTLLYLEKTSITLDTFDGRDDLARSKIFDSRLSAQISKSLARDKRKARFLTYPAERVAETLGGARRKDVIDDGGNPHQLNKQSDHQSSAEGDFWMPQESHRWGRYKLTAWTLGPGRAKDWKHSRGIKYVKRQQ